MGYKERLNELLEGVYQRKIIQRQGIGLDEIVAAFTQDPGLKDYAAAQQVGFDAVKTQCIVSRAYSDFLTEALNRTKE